MKRGAILILMLIMMSAMLLTSAGCASDPTSGWSTKTIYPENVATVSVHIFQNDTYDRDVEFALADSLVKEIETRTGYKVVSDRRADTLLTGRIRRVERDQLSKSRLTGLSEEVLVKVTIDFQWRDLRNGRVLVERQAFTGSGLFVPSQPHGESIELGRYAAVQQLASDIVNEMQAEW